MHAVQAGHYDPTAPRPHQQQRFLGVVFPCLEPRGSEASKRESSGPQP